MNIIEAFSAMKLGHSVRRADWNLTGPTTYIQLDIRNRQIHVYVAPSRKIFKEYLASANDIEANDWEVITEVN